jgi:hypothetical protein
MRTRAGRRDAVVRILLDGVAGPREVGCRLYPVGGSPADPELI